MFSKTLSSKGVHALLSICLLFWPAVKVCAGPQIHETADNGETKRLKDTAVPLSTTSNITGFALANVVAAVPAASLPLPKFPGPVVTVGPVTNASTPGTVITPTVATATTVFARTAFGGSTAIGTAGSIAMVTKGDDPGVAAIAVLDPDIFNGASGQTFEYSYGLIGGYFSMQADGAGGTADIATDAGSNIPGLENFFTLNIDLDGSNPTAIKVNFSSNPRLGLDDAAVESNITTHLIFDSSESMYRLDTDLQYADIAVTVPIGQDTATFTWNTRAVAGSIPEPCSLVLLSSGFAALLCFRQRKRW